ncbi:lipid A-modifier LpxR family protein [Neolewinella antarctica]|uniref:Lipid A deacylase LpxR family protein n=1 Tax=Neolewinella antarctica TaxID=442734 RepID=A0ABX0XEM8_9BACT|nr:lipid A-modifier LpxR family protein [Neolewinella antarctica]NJC27773.1 hypothetical protein [Neolewinella antarctica]
MLFRFTQALFYCCLLPVLALAQVPGHGGKSKEMGPTTERSLRAWAANDVFILPVRTDQYYTAGAGFEYSNIRRERSEIQSITHRRSWLVEQATFTPRDILSTDLLPNDRPFASYLTVDRGQSTTNSPGSVSTDHPGELTTDWGLTAGVLGKYSGGGKLQTVFHNMVDFADELPGWSNEVKPDLILNARYGLDKDWSVHPRYALRTYAKARAGTLFTDLTTGVGADFLVGSVTNLRHVKLGVRGDVRAVGWNATLSGGLLNRDERFRGVVRPARLVGAWSFLATARWGRVGLEASVVQLTREFRGGKNHAYGVIGARWYW